MQTFFINVWQGICNNWEAIVTTFTTGGLGLAIVNFIKQRKQGKIISTNTAASENLLTALVGQENLDKAVNATGNVVNKTLDAVSNVTEKIASLAEKFTAFEVKINAALEVMSVVYSTVKDETVKNTVNNIITNAKYTDIKDKAMLNEELNKVQNMINDYKAKLEQAMSDYEKAKEETTALQSEVEQNVGEPTIALRG